MKRRGVKAVVRFLIMPLNDRGQAVPRGANRPTAKAEAVRITNDRNSVAAKTDLVQRAQQEWSRNDGAYPYLKEQTNPSRCAGVDELSVRQRAAVVTLPNRSVQYDSAGD